MPDSSQLLTWIVVGGLAGAAAGSLVRRKLYFYELMIAGLLGAVVGSLIIKILGINLPDATITFTVSDFITAFIGAVIVIGYAEIVVGARRGGR